MRRVPDGLVLAAFVASCSAGCTHATLVLDDGGTPTPVFSPTPTAAPPLCGGIAGNVCSIGPEGIGDGGPALDARFSEVHGMSLDPVDGSLLVADNGLHRLRRIDMTTGIVTTIAGTGRAGGTIPAGSLATAIDIPKPASVVACPDGTVYWYSEDSRIYAIDSDGTTRLVAGGGASFGDNIVPTTASLDFFMHVDCALDGRVLVLADQNRERVWGINISAAPVLAAGQTIAPNRLKLLAGTGTQGMGPDGVPATGSDLNHPHGALLVATGALFVAETGNHRVRLVNTTGGIATVAGTGLAGSTGDGGAATAARLSSPDGMALDGNNRLFIADGTDRLRVVNRGALTTVYAGTSITAGEIERIAGGGGEGYLDGDGGNALSQSLSFADTRPILLPDGDIAIFDTQNGVIRRFDADDATMSVIAGLAGAVDAERYLNRLHDVEVLADGALVVAGASTYLTRIDPVTGATSVFAGNGTRATSGDGGPATDAGMSPWAIALAPEGAIIVADEYNQVLRRIDADGTIETIAGTGGFAGGGAGDGGPAVAAVFDAPLGVAVDEDGNIYVMDDDRIRAINRQSTSITVANVTIAPGDIDSIAGIGFAAFSGDGGPSTSAAISTPFEPVGMAVHQGVLFFPDRGNNRIRHIDLGTGVIRTLAGNGGTNTGTEGAPLSTPVGGVCDVRVHDGYLYWVQRNGARIRRLPFGGGDVEHVASAGEGYWGDGGPAIDAGFLQPRGFVIDRDGAIFVTDGTHRVRAIAP